MRNIRQQALVCHASALTLVAATMFAQHFLSPVLGERRFLFLYPAVFAVAILGGTGPGILATFFASFCSWIFLVSTNRNYAQHPWAELFGLFVFALTGVVGSVISGNLRNVQARERVARAGVEEAENQRRRGDERLRMALQAAEMNSWEWDLASDRVWRSERHDFQFGLKENLPHFAAADFLGFIHPEDRVRVSEVITGALESGKPFRVEYRVIWPDQSEHWLLSIGNAHRDALGKPERLAGCTVDITQRKIAEERLRRSADQLQDAVSSRDEFLSIASHELKAPITSLKLQLQLARRKFSRAGGEVHSAEAMVKLLDLTTRQVDRLTDLVNDLLDVSRAQAGRLELVLEPVPVAERIQEIVEHFRADLEAAKCPVELSLDSSAIGNWDQIRIEQVLTNLLGNAIKYAPGHPIRISMEGSGERIQICVKDSGPGIPLEKREMIFQRFERASHDRTVSGLGLGLFIVRKIVEAHGGSIRVESAQGEGSCFILDIPMQPEAGVQALAGVAGLTTAQSGVLPAAEVR